MTEYNGILERLEERHGTVKEVRVTYVLGLKEDPDRKSEDRGTPEEDDEEDEKFTAYERIKAVVIEAFNDMPNQNLSPADMTEEVRAHFGDPKIDLKDSTLKSYVNRAINELVDEEKVHKTGFGKYQKGKDFDLDKMHRQKMEIEKGTIGDAYGEGGRNP